MLDVGANEVPHVGVGQLEQIDEQLLGWRGSGSRNCSHKAAVGVSLEVPVRPRSASWIENWQRASSTWVATPLRLATTEGANVGRFPLVVIIGVRDLTANSGATPA